jgi:tetratricopeptide (TPR) repeat protein
MRSGILLFVDTLHIKYRSTGKSDAPQPIRMKAGGWGGLPQRRIDGSEPQPWHCLPFVEGSIHGVELIYPYETECHIHNDNGNIRIEWDFANEPGGGVSGGEFGTFHPQNASMYYFFACGLDLLPPPGYVVRTEPHPRYYTDNTGTFPWPVVGHLQSAWFARPLSVVFRRPWPGQRHSFRKGEAYAQLLFVPHHVNYEFTEMSPQEKSQRESIVSGISESAHRIAENVWRNSAGHAFNDHYKVLSRAFAEGGMEDVRAVIQDARARGEQSLPREKSIPECLQIATQKFAAAMPDEAAAIFQHVLTRDPNNAEATFRLGMIATAKGVPLVALPMLARAVELEPRSAFYHGTLGDQLRNLGRYREAEGAFRAALRLSPGDPVILSFLGLTLAMQGRTSEGLQAVRAALAAAPRLPVANSTAGSIYAQLGQHAEALSHYRAVLEVDPNHREARQAMQRLSSATSQPPPSNAS